MANYYSASVPRMASNPDRSATFGDPQASYMYPSEKVSCLLLFIVVVCSKVMAVHDTALLAEDDRLRLEKSVGIIQVLKTNIVSIKK